MLRTSNFATFNIILFERFLENLMLLPFVILPFILPFISLFRDTGQAKNDTPHTYMDPKNMGLIGLHVYIEELNRLIGSGFNTLLILLLSFI